MTHRRSRIPLAVALALAWNASSAGARDGVLEINQVCAESTGCVPGDAPGFPVTLSAPGSYTLTSVLQLPDENTVGIEVQADYLTIDLNGFPILGTTVCTTSGGAPSCGPLGTGGGIVDPTQSRAGVEVRNGVVARTGGVGIQLGPRCSIEWMRVISNGSHGVQCGDDARFADNVAHLNGGTGLDAVVGATFVRNVATDNASQGLHATHRTVVLENVVARNENGILVDDAGSVVRNVASENRNDGIEGDHGVSVIGNLTMDNNGHGVRCKDGCQITRNVAYDNTFQQLKLGLDSIYSWNVLVGGTGDASGGVTGTGNN